MPKGEAEVKKIEREGSASERRGVVERTGTRTES